MIWSVILWAVLGFMVGCIVGAAVLHITEG
jgi:hypothetical protein